ncbi:MAG TPA: hypothetical protein VFX50_02890 [Gemmatimonadales bacterium]|nr:hypothetical protein [Gemmatimonadales bacterium]
MHDVAATAPFGVAVPRRRRDTELLKLAREVEPSEPGLAVELRGIAMHDACIERRAAPAREAWWRRAGRAAWSALAAYGEARARRDILLLAERWETIQPERAAALRAACARPD